MISQTTEQYQRGLAKLNEIAGDRSHQPLNDWSEVAPDMKRYIIEFVAGEVLSRPGLDTKTRQIVTVAALTAMATAPVELKMHLNGALNVGWTREEIVEVILQMAVFAGFPAALSGLSVAKEVFQERDVDGQS